MAASALFAAVLSTTVVSMARPTIGAQLRAKPSDLQWIIDAYVMVYASLLVAGGVLGDRRGRKGMFILGTAHFGVGSVLCGAAPNLGMLLTGRVAPGSSSLLNRSPSDTSTTSRSHARAGVNYPCRYLRGCPGTRANGEQLVTDVRRCTYCVSEGHN